MDDPRIGGNRREQDAKIASKTHGYGRDSASLTHQEECPAVQKSPKWRIGFAQINVLTARVRKQSREFSVGERSGNCQKTGENPGKQQATRGSGLPRNRGLHNKDARPDHRAHANHLALQESDGPPKPLPSLFSPAPE